MLHVGQGTTVGSLTVFPVWQNRTSSGVRRYDTNPETLQIEEAEGGPTVPQLVATNTGAKPVLVLDGQLFEGGWQHRMATRSTLVGAGARALLDVACVEQHRWGGERAQVTKGRRATTYVRHGYDEVGQQSEVWSRVKRYGGSSATGSLADRLSAPDDQAGWMLKRVRPLPGQTGVIVGIGGQPLALEVFDHPQTLHEQFEVIIRAACLDALGRPALPTPGRRARRLVERLEGTTLDHEPDIGQRSKLGRARTAELDVMSLQQSYRRLHLRATYLRHPILVGA
ncbi:hypothetical protein GCM10027020_32460 [Nocardioides salsibiostraticola]